MPTIEIQVRRFSVVSSPPFEEVFSRLTATIGRPDMNAFHRAVAAATTIAKLEKVVHAAIGSSGLMEFIRFDSGAVLRKELGGQEPKILRLVVGNPLIMKEIVKTVPDAASYAPVTILVDEREDGVHLSYDSMASLIAPYGSEAALAVAAISTRRSRICSRHWRTRHIKRARIQKPHEATLMSKSTWRTKYDNSRFSSLCYRRQSRPGFGICAGNASKNGGGAVINMLSDARRPIRGRLPKRV